MIRCFSIFLVIDSDLNMIKTIVTITFNSDLIKHDTTFLSLSPFKKFAFIISLAFLQFFYINMHLNDAIHHDFISEFITIVEEQCASESLKGITAHRLRLSLFICSSIIDKIF